MLNMQHQIFYAATLLFAWNTLAFRSSTHRLKRPNGYNNYQLRTAQRLILDAYDCNEVMEPHISGRIEFYNQWLDELEITKMSQTHVEILPSTCESTKDIQRNVSPDQNYDRGRNETIRITMNDMSTATPMRRHETALLLQKEQSSIEGGDLVCRVIARSDKKLPSLETITTNVTNEYSFTNVFHQIDDIYHAKAHQQTRQLLQNYMPPQYPTTNRMQQENDKGLHSATIPSVVNIDERERVSTTIRQSLEDAGYELLSRRDLDLCEALNVGYLLRLSIVPDTTKLDPTIVFDMYPERFDPFTKQLLPHYSSNIENDFLFDQRVLVYWRGYSKEVTRGRLLLPKLDYLQASLVQRLFGNVRTLLGRFERNLFISSLSTYRHATACFLHYLRSATGQIPNVRIAKRLRKMIRSPYFYSAYTILSGKRLPTVNEMKMGRFGNDETGGSSVFTLSRYGGTKTKFVGSPNPRDALNPFIICEETINSQGDKICNGNSSLDECPVSNDDDDDDNNEIDDESSRVQLVNERMYESLRRNEIRCPYDKNTVSSASSSTATNTAQQQQPMQLLERVSISNLVDIFTREGRRNLFKTMFTKSELVEPTYEEIVVVWRPLLEQKRKKKSTRVIPKFVIPKIMYELADMFDVQGVLPPVVAQEAEVTKITTTTTTTSSLPPIEILTFEGVPMANLPAVLPKTKLIFRPADAFVFDLISILSFVAIIGSIRFDNPKLDLIAIVSVGLWIIRTLLRYSNKLARYDLLVKKFLTSKITQRNVGAIRYIIGEAGTQRAKRATLVHMWLIENYNTVRHNGLFGGPLLRSQLVENGESSVQRLMNNMKHTPIDIDAALNDLEELQLVRRLEDTGQLLEVTSRHDITVSQTLQRKWGSLFTDRYTARNSRTSTIKSSNR